jgi:hypothetical protein
MTEENKKKLLFEIYKFLEEEGKNDEKLQVASDLVLGSQLLNEYKPSKSLKTLLEIFVNGVEYEVDTISNGKKLIF